MITIDPESFSFYMWPKLDSTHRLAVYWTGLQFGFADNDLVPFDETAQQAVREAVLSKYYTQIEQDPRLAQLHGISYSNLRTRAYAVCRRRQLLEFP